MLISANPLTGFGRLFLLFVVAVSLLGCKSLGGAKPEPVRANIVQAAPVPAYDGPKARLLVAQVQDKTGAGWWTPKLGDGMADQLAIELYNTERYVIASRENQAGADVLGAELLVVAAVTDIQVEPLIDGGEQRSVSVELRLIDVETLKVLSFATLDGATETRVDDVQIGAGGVLVASLARWENTPTELALRDLLSKAVRFIVDNTPADYYRHGHGEPALAPGRQQDSARVGHRHQRLSLGGHDRGDAADSVPDSRTIALLPEVAA